MGALTQLIQMKRQQEAQGVVDSLAPSQFILKSFEKDPSSVDPTVLEQALKNIQEIGNAESGQSGGAGGKGGKGKGGGAGGKGLGDLFANIASLGIAGVRKQELSRRERMQTAETDVARSNPLLKLRTPEARQEIALRMQAVEAAEQRKQQRIADQEAYEDRVKRADATGVTGRDRTEYLLTGKFPTGTGATGGAPRVVYGKIKGQEAEGVQPLSFNPRDPNGYIDVNGRTYTKEQVELTGPPAPTDRLFGRSLEIAKIVEGEGYKRGNPEYNQRFGQIAAADIGTSIAAQQQRMGIAGYESGIGAGQGIPPDRSGGPPAPPAATATPSAAPAATAATPTATPPAKPRLTPRTATATPTPAAVKSDVMTDRFVSMYIDSVFGNRPPGGGAANIGVIKGRDALRKRLGLDPVTFSAVMAGDKAEVKAMFDTVERKVAIERVNNVLALVGDRTIQNAQRVVNTGSPWLTRPWRKIERGATGDPALEAFLIDMNEMTRQYTTLTAGGALSKAMLPEGAAEKVEAILDPNATLQEAIAQVQEVKQFGRMEQQGFATTQQHIVQKILSDVGGRGGTTHFTEGSDAWDIPADKVDAFKRKHPNARAQ